MDYNKGTTAILQSPDLMTTLGCKYGIDTSIGEENYDWNAILSAYITKTVGGKTYYLSIEATGVYSQNPNVKASWINVNDSGDTMQICNCDLTEGETRLESALVGDKGLKVTAFYEYKSGSAVERKVGEAIPFTLTKADSSALNSEIVSKSGNLQGNAPKFYFSGLTWFSILAGTEFSATLPPVKNSETFFSTSQNKSTYDSYVGSTGMKMFISPSGSGATEGLNKSLFRTAGTTYMTYADGILYGISLSTVINIYNVLYVPSGSTDKAGDAADSLNNLLDGSGYSATVEELDADGLNQYYLDNIYDSRSSLMPNTAKSGDTTYKAYMTKEEGLYFYTNRQDPATEAAAKSYDIVEDCRCKSQLFSSEACDIGGKVNNNVDTYKTYKVTINNGGSEVKHFLYLIQEDDTLCNEVTSYTSSNTVNNKVIETQGSNALVPYDTSTTVEAVTSGDAYDDAKSEFTDEKCELYDFTASSNFWANAQFSDMGDGRVEVRIPLGDFEEGKVQPFYYDEETGEVVKITEFTIEDDCVIFTVSHFSMYGLGAVDSAVQKPVTNKTTDTSDSNNLGIYCFTALLALAGLGVLAYRKKIQ